jgi:hypothetical protein
MPEHQGPTDKVEKVELPSEIQRVLWTKRQGAPGGEVGLEVITQFVGNNSEMKIELKSHSGKTLETIKKKIASNRFWSKIKIPDDARDALLANVKLPKHKLEMESNLLIVLPPIEITNLQWDKPEARRGDVLKLTADIAGPPDGTEADVEIWEHDADEVHDLITKLSTEIESNKIELDWEYEYHEDTDEIPTEEELEKGYNPHEYFFRVIVGGISADSDLLLFKDWIEIDLRSESGARIPDAKYVVKMADNTEIEGTLDNLGKARVEDVIPGPYWVRFPEFEEET